MARAYPQKRINRAKALTFLRFQPQEGALTALLADLAQQRKQQLSAAHGGAASMLATLSGVRPQLEGIYSQAGQEHQIAQDESQGALGGLSGPVVDAIRAATARENAGYGNRLATAKASGLSEIGQRQTSTRAGEIAATSQANKVYGTEASKVFDQLASLAAQKGAFINTTLADLTDAARKQAIAKSNLKISQQRVDLQGQGVQLRGQALGETQRHNVATEGAAQKRQSLAHWKARHPTGTKGGAGATPTQLRANRKDWEKIVGAIRADPTLSADDLVFDPTLPKDRLLFGIAYRHVHKKTTNADRSKLDRLYPGVRTGGK